jgi:hypothetical protein
MVLDTCEQSTATSGVCNQNANWGVANGEANKLPSLGACRDMCLRTDECVVGFFIDQPGPKFGECWLSAAKSATAAPCMAGCTSFEKKLNFMGSQKPLQGICDWVRPETVSEDMDASVSMQVYSDNKCTIEADSVPTTNYGRQYCIALESGQFAQFYLVGNEVSHAYFSDPNCTVVIIDQIYSTCGAVCEKVIDPNSGESFYVTTKCQQPRSIVRWPAMPGPWNRAFKMFVKNANLTSGGLTTTIAVPQTTTISSVLVTADSVSIYFYHNFFLICFI